MRSFGSPVDAFDGPDAALGDDALDDDVLDDVGPVDDPPDKPDVLT